jgi:hypothetical protein
MLLGGQAIAGSTLKAGDRISPTSQSASESEDFIGLTGAQIALTIAGIAAAVLIYNEIEDDPDSP